MGTKYDAEAFDSILIRPYTTKSVIQVFISYGLATPFFSFRGRSNVEKKLGSKEMKQNQKLSNHEVQIPTIDPMLDSNANQAFKSLSNPKELKLSSPKRRGEHFLYFPDI